MKIAGWDLEIQKVVPLNCPQCNQDFTPTLLDVICPHCNHSDYITNFGEGAWVDAPGISCLGIYWDGELNQNYKVFYNADGLTVEQARDAIRLLHTLHESGHIISTVNGLGFDFKILVELAANGESDWFELGTWLALSHFDMMLVPLCMKGFPVGLDAMAHGYGLGGKLKYVTLSNGKTLDSMSGALAPLLWQMGETRVVLDYLYEDCKSTYDVASSCLKSGMFRWVTKKGKLNNLALPGLLRASDYLNLPLPDTSWMTYDMPVTRQSTQQWITERDA